jgi:hypothetical protein
VNRGGQLLGRCSKLALLPQRHAQCVMRVGLIGIQVGSFAELRDGLRQVVL